jgi:hypothetical protein
MTSIQIIVVNAIDSSIHGASARKRLVEMGVSGIGKQSREEGNGQGE